MSCEECIEQPGIFLAVHRENPTSVPKAFRCSCEAGWFKGGYWQKVAVWDENKFPFYEGARAFQMRAVREPDPSKQGNFSRRADRVLQKMHK